MPKQFADFDAPRMRDNQTPRAFHSRCEALVPCIKIGDNKLAQCYFLNKLTDNESWKEAMKMWVSDRPWKDILIPGHDRETVIQLRRQKTPRDLPRGQRRGGRGPRGQGGRERHEAGHQRGTQWKLFSYPPGQRRRTPSSNSSSLCSCTGRTKIKLATVTEIVAPWPAAKGETDSDGEESTK